ncbi:uncharacterized protein [Vulpes vulpes]|uniref:Collagen alpha-1(I) chain-like n=1 Tax=Vulpes vulpes TaxID=9627 RepID=A0ABM5AM96_VULVU
MPPTAGGRGEGPGARGGGGDAAGGGRLAPAPPGAGGAGRGRPGRAGGEGRGAGGERGGEPGAAGGERAGRGARRRLLGLHRPERLCPRPGPPPPPGRGAVLRPPRPQGSVRLLEHRCARCRAAPPSAGAGGRGAAAPTEPRGPGRGRCGPTRRPEGRSGDSRPAPSPGPLRGCRPGSGGRPAKGKQREQVATGARVSRGVCGGAATLPTAERRSSPRGQPPGAAGAPSGGANCRCRPLAAS